MNAFIGVLAGKTDDEFDFKDMDGFPVIPIEPGYTGGIIMSHSSEFRNNKIGVYLPEYENFHPVNEEPKDNLSYFINCDFNLTQSCLSGIDSICFVQLNDVSGLLFEGNYYINSRTGASIKAIGIQSLNSSFRVKEHCTDNYVPCQNIRMSRFQNLEFGLHVIGAATMRTFSVDTTEFVSNMYAINTLGVNNFEIFRSVFNLNFAGIRLDNTTSGFRIEENDIQGEIENIDYGIQFINTGEARNDLYKNYFTSLFFGIYAHKQNRSITTDNGLEIKCNVLKQNTIDIIVWDFDEIYAGIAPYQGSPANNPDAPAGNQFSWSTDYPESDILNLGEHITYYHHKLGTGPDQLEPIYYTSEVTVSENEYVAWGQNSCLSNLGSSGEPFDENELIFLLADSKQQAEVVDNYLSILTDGGNTEELDWQVIMSATWQSLEVYNELMSISPYVSDDVLASAIQKENVLVNAMIRNILVANPHSAKNAELLGLLDQRLQPLPEYMWNEILEGRDIVSVYENLKATRSYYRSQEADYQKQLIHLYLNENNDASRDKIVNLLLDDNSLQQWYQAAFIRHECGDNIAAMNILNTIPSSFSLDSEKLAAHNDILSFINMAEDLRQQGLSITMPDSATVAWLLDMMDNGTGLASNYAHNILVAHGIVEYEPEMPLPDFNKSVLIKPGKHLNAASPDDLLKVFPNPAKEYVIVNYDTQGLYPEDAESWVSLTGIDGKNLERVPLQKDRDQVVFQLKGYKPGTYVVSILHGNRIISSKNLIIR